MGNVKGMDVQIPDGKWFICPYDPVQSLRHLAQSGHALHLLHGSPGTVDGNLIFSGDDTQTFYMVRVLMGDQDTVTVLCGAVNGVEPFLNLLAADPHIYQDAGVVTAHVNTVAAASAGNTT